MSDRWLYPALLVLLGAGWGITQPLGKIAASTGHGPFGMIFWQLVICTLILGGLTYARGKRLVLTAPALRFYVFVAILGTLGPNATFYMSIVRLPSGIMSIIISTVPLLALLLSLALGVDRLSGMRVLGLILGLSAVAMIALPKASLPDPAMVAFLPLALIGPLFYASESVYVARNGTAGMDAIQAMFGASLVGLILCIPLMLLFGHEYMMQWPLARQDWALVWLSAIHGVVYAAYVWLAARAGSVFAAQCSYLVTICGVIWSMLLLGETLTPWVWGALVLMLAGMSLVKPRLKTVDA